MPFNRSEDPYFTYEDGYYNPEEENERVMVRIESPNNTQNTKSYQELESREERLENVDARLHRMLLQKDLPLKSVLLSSREGSSSNIQNSNYYTEGGSRHERSENLDEWLPKMMLEEALPVKLVSPPRSESFSNSLEIKSGEEKVNLSNPVAVVLRKDLKRLGKRNFDMNTTTLKKIRNQITNKVKGQVKEDIMELLLTEKIEAWFQSHENEVKL